MLLCPDASHTSPTMTSCDVAAAPVTALETTSSHGPPAFCGGKRSVNLPSLPTPSHTSTPARRPHTFVFGAVHPQTGISFSRCSTAPSPNSRARTTDSAGDAPSRTTAIARPRHVRLVRLVAGTQSFMSAEHVAMTSPLNSTSCAASGQTVPFASTTSAVTYVRSPMRSRVKRTSAGAPAVRSTDVPPSESTAFSSPGS